MCDKGEPSRLTQQSDNASTSGGDQFRVGVGLQMLPVSLGKVVSLGDHLSRMIELEKSFQTLYCPIAYGSPNTVDEIHAETGVANLKGSSGMIVLVAIADSQIVVLGLQILDWKLTAE